jgi:hypothetical protein
LGEVEIEAAVWGDVVPHEWVQGPQIDGFELDGVGGVVEHVLDHEGVHVDQYGLEEVEARHGRPSQSGGGFERSRTPAR